MHGKVSLEIKIIIEHENKCPLVTVLPNGASLGGLQKRFRKRTPVQAGDTRAPVMEDRWRRLAALTAERHDLDEKGDLSRGDKGVVLVVVVVRKISTRHYYFLHF